MIGCGYGFSGLTGNGKGTAACAQDDIGSAYVDTGYVIGIELDDILLFAEIMDLVIAIGGAKVKIICSAPPDKGTTYLTRTTSK